MLFILFHLIFYISFFKLNFLLPNVLVSFHADLSSGESEEEEGVCGMSGEKVRLHFVFLDFQTTFS